MSKVLFITVRNYTSNEWINDKMLQYTHANQIWWADNQYECVIVDSYNDINKYLGSADWLVVQTAGDTIMERTHLWNKLHSIPDDVGFIGHLVWYPYWPSPHFHPQCFIIRTYAVKEFNVAEGTTNSVFTRSTEDMHQGKAPLELYLDSTGDSRTHGNGTKVLEQVLSAGYRVVNFDHDWRFGANTCPIELSDNFKQILNNLGWPQHPSRGFCYPENSTDLFERALKDFVVYPELDISQQMYIEIIKKVVALQNHGVVNILNWDVCNTTDKHDHIVCPAGGLFGEIAALKTSAKRITVYDINQHTLDFKRSLYEQWDGKDFIEYANAWASERGLITEPRWDKAQQLVTKQDTDINSVITNWDYFKSLEVEFVHCNIISDTAKLLPYITENSLLHTSTILNYYPVSMISHTKRDIDVAKDLILEQVKITRSTWTES